MDDLLKRLRNPPFLADRCHIMAFAADRIEELALQLLAAQGQAADNLERANRAEAMLKEAVEKSQAVLDAWEWWQKDPYDRDQSVPHDAIDDLRATLARIEAAQEGKE